MLLIQVEPLSSHPELRPAVTRWLTEEWPSYYSTSALASFDVQAYSKSEGLPRGFVAMVDGMARGFAALKAESFQSHSHLGPWAGAAYVTPHLRRRGIGAALLAGLEAEAAVQGNNFVYCATATATSVSLLERAGWRLLEQVVHDGHNVGVYEKAL